MRQIKTSKITQTIKDLLLKANYELNADVLKALRKAYRAETSSIAKKILGQILENVRIARKDKLPICQDTGLVTVFLEIGQDVHITGGSIEASVNQAVRTAYLDLRKSVLDGPLSRKNTGDNTPAIIHTKIIPGNKIKIGVMAKGGGAENSSALKMFLPTASKEDIIKFVVGLVKEKGANACPPLIIGVGMGGNFNRSAYLAKLSLRKKIGKSGPLEREILNKVNQTGLGPMGLGGKTTALAVHILTEPCHIASLPVAVNLECHAHRYKEAVL